MPQFLIPRGKKPGDSAALSPEESKHLAKVLRASPGDTIRLTDGEGGLFRGIITQISPKGVTVSIDGALAAATARGRILLLMGLLKGEKMEFILQKAAELGVAEIQPFMSSRTIAAWKKDERKLERWRKIAEAASKQSGRATHLKVSEPAALEKALEVAADVKIVFWEDGGEPLRNFLAGRKPDRIAVLVGPEGGLSQEEVDRAIAAGFAVLSLGQLILRAETAALTAVSIVQYELGNI